MSTVVCVSEEYVLLPTYLGKRVTKITVHNVSPHTDVHLLQMLLEQHVEIIETRSTAPKNWAEIQVELKMLLTPVGLSSIPECIYLTNGDQMRVVVEGRRPRCYGCGSMEHQRALCPRARGAGPPVMPTPQQHQQRKEHQKQQQQQRQKQQQQQQPQQQQVEQQQREATTETAAATPTPAAAAATTSTTAVAASKAAAKTTESPSTTEQNRTTQGNTLSPLLVTPPADVNTQGHTRKRSSADVRIGFFR